MSEKRNDEIDLIELFLKFYIFIKKNFWFLFISGIIGGCLGYSTKFITKEYYESSMLVESYTLSNDLIIEYINGFQNILLDENYQYLNTKTGLEEIESEAINEIIAKKLYDEINEENLKYIKVSVKSNSNLLFENLSTGLLKYFISQKYVMNEIELFVEQNNTLISKIDDEIKQLEKLQQKTITQTPSKGDVNIYNDQKSFQSELLGLLKEKQYREKLLKFATPFRVIQDFTIYQRPITKSKTYALAGALILGFIAFLYLAFKRINIKLKEQEANL